MQKSTMAVAVAVALLLLVIGSWWWREGAERRAIGDLPRERRAALYHKELDSFRALCVPPPRAEALQLQCKERAAFIRLFPECEADCRKLAQQFSDAAQR